MAVPSLTKLAVAAGCLALSLSAGAGLAAAGPDLGPFIHTTCTYQQVTLALNSVNPAAAADFADSPGAQSWLQTFLSATPNQRQHIAAQIEAMPGAQQYVDTMMKVVDTCKDY